MTSMLQLASSQLASLVASRLTNRTCLQRFAITAMPGWLRDFEGGQVKCALTPLRRDLASFSNVTLLSLDLQKRWAVFPLLLV